MEASRSANCETKSEFIFDQREVLAACTASGHEVRHDGACGRLVIQASKAQRQTSISCSSLLHYAISVDLFLPYIANPLHVDWYRDAHLTRYLGSTPASPTFHINEQPERSHGDEGTCGREGGRL